MARPAIEITAEMIAKVEQLAAQGLTNEQIARSIGIHPGTLYAKKAQNNELNEAIKTGKAKGLATITNALFTAAKSGNITAQIFYLKNRGPEEWMDRKAVEFSGYIADKRAEDMSDDELAAIAETGRRRASDKKDGKTKPARVH